MNEDNGKGYGCFVMAVAGIALFIALIALRKWDTPLFGLSASDVTVTDTLSLLVTILIGWQIWQTIDARNVIKEFRRESNLMQAQAKLDIQNTRMLCMALLATHEGETEAQRKNFADAYMKYFTSLALFMMIKDPEDAVRIEDSLSCVEKILNDNIKNRDTAFLSRLKEVESDIDKIYETLIIFSEKVSLPQDKITRIKELHKKRKNYTTPEH